MISLKIQRIQEEFSKFVIYVSSFGALGLLFFLGNNRGASGPPELKLH
jgi:hypothetical protein